ncbi:MAG: hypothetical protein IJS28_07550 [Synergistaceae bacterium]|nr:hypothetical protein [Synergistaceae bacterium]
MSLTYVKPQQQQKSGGILGTLGTLASIGGMAFGQPWLSALGMGMSGVDSLMNGGSSSGGSTQAAKQTGGALSELLKGIKTGWENPAAGNIGSGQPGDDTKVLQKIREINSEPSDDEFAQRWGGYSTPVWSTGATGNMTPPLGMEFDPRGGCFGTGGWRAANPFNGVFDLFRGY